jgi:hypothetical protein
MGIMNITIGFEGQQQDLNALFFDLFEAGMLREGLEKETPGGAKIVMKRRPLRKGYAHALMEIGLFAGRDVALPLFLAWLYDKWKGAGEKPITIIIENRPYQFDVEVLTKALDEAIAGGTSRGRQLSVVIAPSAHP